MQAHGGTCPVTLFAACYSHFARMCTLPHPVGLIVAIWRRMAPCWRCILHSGCSILHRGCNVSQGSCTYMSWVCARWHHVAPCDYWVTPGCNVSQGSCTVIRLPGTKCLQVATCVGTFVHDYCVTGTVQYRRLAADAPWGRDGTACSARVFRETAY